MTRNVGTVDRLVRAAIAVLLVGLGLALVHDGWPLLALGALIGLTAAAGFCPLYRLYRLSTVGGLHRNCEDGDCSWHS